MTESCPVPTVQFARMAASPRYIQRMMRFRFPYITEGWKLPRLRHDSRVQRRAALRLYGILLIGAVAVTGAWAWLIWQGSGSTADHLAETGDLLTGGTLALALIAGFVALQAYAAATGLPDLEFQITFGFSLPNRPVLRATSDEYGQFQIAAPFRQIYSTVTVRNMSGYSARNPAVIIRLRAMAFSPSLESKGWVDIDFAQTQGVTAVQWDGGDYSIHGRSSRRLPGLDFTGLHTIPEWGEPAFVIELLAEGGYRREIEIPVRFIPDDNEWEEEIPASDRPPSWL